MPSPIAQANFDGPVEIFPGLTMVPTGGRIAVVHSSGAAALTDLPVGLADPGLGFHTSVQAALAACRTARGDRVVCLPRHVESIAIADAWSNLGTKTDIKVVCLGEDDERAQFTWTTATSSVLFDQAGFGIVNARLFMAGADAAGAALTVAAPITISAPGCALLANDGRFGFDVDQLVTIGITTTAAADRLRVGKNRFIGDTTSECTTFLQLVGVDDLWMYDNTFAGATSSTGVGIVRFATTASLNIKLERNTYINRKAASAAAVTGLAGVSGESHNEFFHYLDNSSTTPWVTSPGIMAFNNPRLVNLAGEVGMLPTVIST